MDSYHFYTIAKESYYKARQGFAIHRQNDALVSIIFAALSLEAFINELGSLAKEAKANGYSEDFLDKLIDAIDESNIKNIEDKTTQNKNKTTQAKFLDASEALSNKFNKGARPYQDFADLFSLRNCLVHLKPQDRFEIDVDNNWIYSGRNLINRLRSKNIVQSSTQIESITLLVSTADVARWACDTASAIVNAILDRIPDSTFSRDNQVLALYKDMFQPLETDEQQILKEEFHHRQTVVLQTDQLRKKLLETYGEFPDSVELIREDRSR